MKHLISKAVRLEIRRTDFISAQLNQPVLIVVKHQLPKYHQAVNCSGRGTAFILKTHRDEFYSLLKTIFFSSTEYFIFTFTNVTKTAYFISDYNDELREFLFCRHCLHHPKFLSKFQFWKMHNLRKLNKPKYLHIDKGKPDFTQPLIF